jgi:hypothetical protein
MKFFQHLRTVNHHKWLVLKGCFRVGLYWQGLTHDLSKYSPTEFLVGARYWQGTRSPNAAERDEKGYSEAWMHHKGRNRHHYEYWTDMNKQTKTYESMPMPRKYLAEMVADRIAACKVYEKENYTPASALNYLNRSTEKNLLHPQIRQTLEFLLTMLKDKGEKETFRYIRKQMLKGKPFPWEEQAEIG